MNLQFLYFYYNTDYVIPEQLHRSRFLEKKVFYDLLFIF